MRQIETQIEINATSEAVWKLITDLDGFGRWNPFIKSASGEVKRGSKLDVQIEPPGAKPMTFKPTVLKVDPGREYRWRGRLVIPGIFDGEHIFEITPLDTDRVRFTQRERFSGVLVPLFWKMLDINTRQGFEDMNTALKNLAERQSNRPPDSN